MAKRRMDAVDALKLAIERERGANKFYRRRRDIWRYWKKNWGGSPNRASTSRSTGSLSRAKEQA